MAQPGVSRVERELYESPSQTPLPRAANDNADNDNNYTPRQPNIHSVEVEHHNTVRNIGTTAQAGKATEMTGKSVRNAGGNLKRAARNERGVDLLRPGRRLSGAQLPGAAKILQSKNVQRMLKRGPLPLKVAGHGIDAAAILWEKRKVTRANATIFSTGFPLWLSIQLPLAALSTAFLGAAFTLKTIEEKVSSTAESVLGETVTYLIGKAYEYTIGSTFTAVEWIFSQLFGFSLTEVFDPTNYFIATHYLVVIIGWSTLLVATMLYLSAMVNPFTGEGWKWKMGGFLIAAIGYLLPVLNMLPWFAVWTLAVWKNPE